jgi:hypothetical protein
MSPKKSNCHVAITIRISQEQSAKLVEAEAAMMNAIHKLCRQNNALNFAIIRCNLENPMRKNTENVTYRSSFFGSIIVGGNIPYEELSSAVWSSKLLELRTKIRQHVVEVSGIRFSRIRTVRGARGKLKD